LNVPELNLVELNLDTLGQLMDGQILAQFERLLEQAIADCEKRPNEAKSRKVIAILNITPKTRVEQIDDTHTRTVLDGLGLTLDMDVKVPARKTIEFDCGVGIGHKLLFNPHNAHNHRQQPLPLVLEGSATVPMRA
jgi:hypothetical protein